MHLPIQNLSECLLSALEKLIISQNSEQTVVFGGHKHHIVIAPPGQGLAPFSFSLQLVYDIYM